MTEPLTPYERSLYLIGSLRNPEIPKLGNQLRSAGWKVFDDWYAAGPHADDCWRDYEKGRGHTLPQALRGRAARHVYGFDLRYLSLATHVVLALPAGKSGHLELGWALGQGKKGFVLLDGDPNRYDVMYQFADAVVETYEELVDVLSRY